MEKTVVVKIERLKEHPKYRKRYRIFDKYKAHDERNECQIGDEVTIEECRPLSKEKKWRVIKRVTEVAPQAKESKKEDSAPSNEN